MGPRIRSALVMLAFCAQGLAAFAPARPDPCACTGGACCRAAKRPAPARGRCHDAQPEPSARLQCHHPEQDVQLPVTIALLPVSPTTAPAGYAEALAGRSATSLLPGFSRLDLPPPRPPRTA
jgi:hypothetical protein